MTLASSHDPRTPRAAARRAVLAVLLIVSPFAALPAAADWDWGDNCRHQADVERTVDLDGIRRIEIRAGAGPLHIRGVHGAARQLRASGIACARSQSTLERVGLEVGLSADTLRLETRIPPDEAASIDLEVVLPDDLPLYVQDSSGSLVITDVDSLDVKDSSGSIRIERVAGRVNVIADSSGSMEIRDVGDVVIERDSSGSITVDTALSLRIEEDSSGSINARRITGDVYIGRDTSGSIDVYEVGGNFTVVRDGSGGISHERVGGMVQLGRNDRR